MASEPTLASVQDAEKRAKIDLSLRHPVMFFFTSGAAWLAVALVLGIISSIKMHAPGFLSECSWFTTGRVQPAHMNALIYGWGVQAALGIIIWLMSRLSRQECRAAGMILAAGHLWNLGVSVGLLGILAGFGTGVSWMEFPTAVWPFLAISYALITIWSVIQFRVREGGHIYVSQWYLLGAIFWFPWIYLTANLLIFVFDANPVFSSAVNAWFRSGLVYLFFIPVAIASAYYIAPKVSGRPVFSYSLALLGFWSLAILMPWAGMQKLTGSPIPVFLTTWGAAATVLFMIPAVAVGVNVLKTISFGGETWQNSPSLRFTATGIIALIVFGVLGMGLNTVSALRYTQFTIANYGMDVLALYGVFSLCAFGAIYFIVPRITRREWLSGRFISMHYWFSLYGTILIVLFAVFGGLMQGVGQENYLDPWNSAAGRGTNYFIGITISLFFVIGANLFFFLHLALMWLRLGRRSSHPTLLPHGHGDSSPHGPEGDLEALEASKA